MQKLVFLFLFLCLVGFSQENSSKQITATLRDSTKLEAKAIFGIDNFGTLYYATENNSFHKKTKDTIITYANFQLGDITTANTFNPLKINLFYRDFNTVVVLDNRLAEIKKIDFNTIQPYKNVSFVSSGYDNSIWLFNQDFQYLELYDFKSNKIKLKTVPVQSEVLDLKSDYNYCYLLTKNYLYVYNYFGSLIRKIENSGYESLAFNEAHLILKKEKSLFILEKNASDIKPIKHPNLLIKQFLVTNETVYIYHENLLRQYHLKIE
ncbi:hypothetical protein [Winogradskyella sediminis]|uniref:Uncharacterized protein n=1 Tax=Winogradskyella sediminis TaxID=1382466 RepID=A0A1H1TV44_9FLAO|nr:hypothetical protein [Winogradskyella sediminis]REG88882.1 hypothetical protein C8N41_101114 [Winogradskyella sediminis]SDS64068.1 hypothetical protein SAMN04489797_2052 [Winogradskyella sediminis]